MTVTLVVNGESVSRGDKGSLFVLLMDDPTYRVPTWLSTEINIHLTSSVSSEWGTPLDRQILAPVASEQNPNKENLFSPSFAVMLTVHDHKKLISTHMLFTYFSGHNSEHLFFFLYRFSRVLWWELSLFFGWFLLHCGNCANFIQTDLSYL